MEVYPHSAELPGEFRNGRTLPEEVLSRCLKSCGRGVKVFEGCRLVPPSVISIGDFSQVDEGASIFGGEEVVIGRHVHLALGSSISGGGRCFIEDFAGIGAGVRIITGTEIVDGSGLTNPTVPPDKRVVRRGVVRIGRHAVVFTNSVVLPDVVIGEGAVVAAGSIVHHHLKPWGIYAGTPLVQVGIRPSATILAQAAEL